ncbi:unnamed protein product [Fusarium equiseti]|uniref:Uncharacterized protein n=1 Tax=Fusarium equiseti TaxID=61235 RepID=A0A8J2ISC5_FUSEQ|nr:unnamed protein product [Fusarium equiseti]
MLLNFKLLLLTCLPIGLVQGQGNSDCAQWCKKNFPKPGDVCTDPASEGKGPCFQCGPKKTSLSMQLCSGSCTDTSTDNANCGSCGKACSSGKFCSGGVCKSRACDNPFSCGGAPTFCGSGPPGSLCVCFSTSGG